MERSVLSQILDQLEGVEKKADGHYQVPEETRVSAYVGAPGEGMVITDVDEWQLEDAFLRVGGRENGTIFFLAYEDLHAVSSRPPKAPAGRRTGFA